MVLIGAYIALSLTVSEVISLQVCGKNLADMLDLVCDGRGFYWTSRENSGVPRISKRSALQYLNAFSEPRARGRRSGVVNECCKRPCSISHLESYCAAGPGTYLPMPMGRHSPTRAIETTTPEPTTTTTTATTTTARPTVRTTTRAPLRICRRVINGLRMPCFRSPFFFVRPVGPRPTRVPVL